MCFYFCSLYAEWKPCSSIVLSALPKILTMRKSEKWGDNNLIFSQQSFFLPFLSSLHHHTEPFSVLRSHLFCLILIQIIINSVSLLLSLHLINSGIFCCNLLPVSKFSLAASTINFSLLSSQLHNCLAICLSTYISGCLTSIDSINAYLTLFHILSYQSIEWIGSFAAMTSFLNHFEILAVKNTATLSALQKIFCTQFLKVHPDKHSKKKKNKWTAFQQELQNFYNVIFIKSLHLIYMHQFATELKVYFNYTKVNLCYELSMYNAESKAASENTDSDLNTSENEFHEWFNEQFEQNEQNKQKEKNSFNTADEEQEVDNTFKKHFTNDNLQHDICIKKVKSDSVDSCYTVMILFNQNSVIICRLIDYTWKGVPLSEKQRDCICESTLSKNAIVWFKSWALLSESEQSNKLFRVMHECSIIKSWKYQSYNHLRTDKSLCREINSARKCLSAENISYMNYKTFKHSKLNSASSLEAAKVLFEQIESFLNKLAKIKTLCEQKSEMFTDRHHMKVANVYAVTLQQLHDSVLLQSAVMNELQDD